MHIVVCVKVTSSTTNSAYDPKSGGGSLKEARQAINPFDEYAIEEAVRLVGKLGGNGTISALSMGPANAEEALKEAVARGCHSATLLTDPAFEGSDTFATSHILYKGLQKLSEQSPVNLVICGKQTNDSDTGLVGPGLAAWWDAPHVSFVRKVRDIQPNKITVERMMEDGTDVLEMELPALFTIVKEINEPRIVSLKGKMAAKKAQVAKWSAQDIGVDTGQVGKEGSPLWIGEPEAPPARSSGVKVEGSTPQEIAANLLAKLREKGLV